VANLICASGFTHATTESVSVHTATPVFGYKFDRTTIAAALRRLVATEGVRLEDGATTGLALAAYENGAADFSDFFILESARRGGALPLHTFDERLTRVDGAKLVE